MDRHRVEVMQLLAAMLEGGDEVGGLENSKVFGDGLPRHGEAVAEFVQGLSVFGVKPVQQRPPRRIGQRFEDLIHERNNRQPNGCMSSAHFCGRYFPEAATVMGTFEGAELRPAAPSRA